MVSLPCFKACSFLLVTRNALFSFPVLWILQCYGSCRLCESAKTKLCCRNKWSPNHNGLQHKDLVLIILHVHCKSVQLGSNCFYPGTLDDGTASIWNTANLRVEKKKKWQAISESKSNCLETTHATSAYTSWARGNLMGWPGISCVGKYNPPLGCEYSGTVIQFTMCVIVVRMCAAQVLMKMYLLLYQGTLCAVAQGQEASESLAGTEFLTGALGPYFLPRPGLQHLSFSSTHYRTIHYGFWVCLATRLRSGLASLEQAWASSFSPPTSSWARGLPVGSFLVLAASSWNTVFVFFYYYYVFHPRQPFHNTLPADSSCVSFWSDFSFHLVLLKIPIHSSFWPAWHYCHRFLSFFPIYFSVTQISPGL